MPLVLIIKNIRAKRLFRSVTTTDKQSCLYTCNAKCFILIQMKNPLTLICLLFYLCSAKPVIAQKAYDVIRYEALIYGRKTTLLLADGYLLASKISIHSNYGDEVFSPDSNEPDSQGYLRFIPVKGTGRYKNNEGSWVILKGLNSPEYPSKIKAVYWDGKMRITVGFTKRK